MAPLALVHALVIHHDASRVCPRRLDWQMRCADQKCHDCSSHNQLNIADCDVRLTSGLTARTIAAAVSLKSGVRRMLMTSRFGNIAFDDIDMERLTEQDYGELFIFLTANF